MCYRCPMLGNLVIRDAVQLDPVAGTETRGDIYVCAGRISDTPPTSEVPVFDAAGYTVMPGLIDLHVHFREPGNTNAETIASGSRAAARGGFTTVVTMPNTRPPVDSPAAVTAARAAGDACGDVHLLPSACITADRRGRVLADLTRLAAAGAIAFTDDGNTVSDDALMRAAMERSVALGRPIMDHAQDAALAGRGVMHEGAVSQRLGLPGMSHASEDRVVARDVALARETGCAVHIQHLTSGGSAAIIRDARADGVPVTAEVTPHHLALCDEDIPGDDADFKMNPPLRTRADREALIAGVLDGTLSVFATDHAPHLAELKARGFVGAPFGVVGLETALGITYTELVQKRGMPRRDWLRGWTTAPAAVLGLTPPSLAPGATADLVVADLTTPWTIDRTQFVSRSRNTPFDGRTCVGHAVLTVRSGTITWQRD